MNRDDKIAIQFNHDERFEDIIGLSLAYFGIIIITIYVVWEFNTYGRIY